MVIMEAHHHHNAHVLQGRGSEASEGDNLHRKAKQNELKTPHDVLFALLPIVQHCGSIFNNCKLCVYGKKAS